MTSSEGEGWGCVQQEGTTPKGGFHRKRTCNGLMFWLHITADDDLIHKAHYCSTGDAYRRPGNKQLRRM